MLENASSEMGRILHVPPHGPCGAFGAGQPWASTARFRDPLEKEPLGRGKWVFRGLHAASALPFRLLVCYARAERLAPGSHGTERPWWWRSVGYGAVGARKVWFWGSVHAEPVFWVFGLFVWYVCGDGSVGWCFVFRPWGGATVGELSARACECSVQSVRVHRSPCFLARLFPREQRQRKLVPRARSPAHSLTHSLTVHLFTPAH